MDIAYFGQVFTVFAVVIRNGCFFGLVEIDLQKGIGK